MQGIALGLEVVGEGGADHPRDLAHVVGVEPAGRQGGRPDPQAGRVHRRTLVERDRVPVDGDPDLLEALLGRASVEALGGDVDEHEVDVGAAGQHRDAAGDQLVGEGLSVDDRRPLALAELLGGGDLHRDGLGGDHVHERAALVAGEDRPVDVGPVLLAAEDHAAARPGERLVDRRRDDVGVLDRVRVLTGGDEPGEVGHVDHQQRARPNRRSRGRRRSRAGAG